MYYDAPPMRDARYARRIILDANRDLSRFVQTYLEAKGKNDLGLFMEANHLRAVVVAAWARLAEERDSLPDEFQGVMGEAIARIREYLAQISTPPRAQRGSAKGI